MRNLLSPITKSRQELKKVSTITACAMFGALSVVLSYYSIRVTPNLKVGLGALPNELVDYLFGPFVGPLFGGAMDIIKYMLQPDGGFMPGFTFNAMLAALNGLLGFLGREDCRVKFLRLQRRLFRPAGRAPMPPRGAVT